MSKSSVVRAAALSLALAATSTATAAAQDSTATSQFRNALSELSARSSMSITAIQSRPQGVLGRNIGVGYGASAAYLLRLDNAGILSLRAEAGVSRYGHESRETPFSEPVGGRVLLDVTTANYVVPMNVGAQLAAPRGIVRPYVNAGLGGMAFFTESSVNGSDTNESIATTTNQSSTTASWSVGGGLLVPVLVGKVPFAIDAGVQYLSGGNARYLAPGSIVDLPGSRIEVNPIESTTRMMVVRIGGRIGR